MMTASEAVTMAVVDLHDFFTAWFNGTVPREHLESRFLSHLHESFVFIPPAGHVVSRSMLKDSFNKVYGTNTTLRIQIRDVKVRHEIGSTVLATYTEWQAGTNDPDGNNARVTSVLMDIDDPLTWLHIQETWLPEAERLAGASDI